ncbi:MAG: ankyrin repeat domain-containing protein [Firmicutes bacterium]|nr:ankyrin repeat domain-containing protein [Bacillota bacterium]
MMMKLFSKVAVILIFLMMVLLTGCTDNEKAMVEAVQKGDTPMVQSLLDKGVSPNLKTDDGKTILMLAAYLGHTDITRLLLNEGAEVNAKDNGGKTALMYAAQAGNIEMARLLLESGADLNAVDENGQNALQIAQAYHQTDMVEFLSNWGKPTPTPAPALTATPNLMPSPTPVPANTPTPTPIATSTPAPTPMVFVNQKLGSIFFDYDKSALRSDQVQVMEKFLITVRDNPTLHVILGGHADDRGTREYNKALSLRRARTIHKFLTDNGINPGRIIIYGYGKDHPLKTGHDEVSRSYNRRVDILLWDSLLDEEEALAETLK